jgi:hypothetical protein
LATAPEYVLDFPFPVAAGSFFFEEDPPQPAKRAAATAAARRILGARSMGLRLPFGHGRQAEVV